ncbi:MAG: hypothetical protein EHM45_05275 [Desulfobacteraceae bacterium]|nr:MAG: hypothetical protein EHM45_05275 [Desulfobacteraceae bacterium]
MKLKHAPGKWEVTGSDNHLIACSTTLDGGKEWTSIVCEAWSRPWAEEAKRMEEKQANARLIAAAPDMLKALINKVEEYKKAYPLTWYQLNYTQEMIIAIQSATGISIKEVLK